MFKVTKLITKAPQLQFNSYRFMSAFNKVCNSVDEALADLKDGQTVLSGGFGLCGIPENLIKGVQKKGTKNLTIISNNCGIDDAGLGVLLKDKQIKRMICSYCGENKELERQYLSGELEIEFVPQGTLAEKARAGGAGIPAFYTPTGVGTTIETGGFPIKYKAGTKDAEILSEPRQRASFKGRDYILEPSFFGDVALIKAWKADTKGNLIFNKTARNMNQDFATAAKVVIAEVEEVVEAGELDPNQVHVPGVYISKVIKGKSYEKRIEKVVHSKEGVQATEVSKAQQTRDTIARRACKEITNGMYINLGIGIPTLVPAFLPPGVEVELESENGVLGVGDYPKPGQEEADLINAGKETITTLPGSSFFSSSQSFGIIRGKHLDMTILGAMQVSESGDLANWVIPGKLVKGMGGAMDLVGSGSKVMVTMEHTAKGGAHKLLKECNLPLTGKGVVDILVTEMCTFEFTDNGVVLKDIEQGYTVDDIKKNTGFSFKVASHIKH